MEIRQSVNIMIIMHRTSTTDIDQADIDNCEWNANGKICLENDATYTVFVVTRADEGTYVS